MSGGDEEESDKILKLFRYKILLVSNPDGYKYSFSNDPGVRRMQRKNRRIFDNCSDFANPAGDGDGVDLNRNFATGFDKGRPQDYGRFSYDRLKQCSMTYGGEEAFSEPETRAIRDAMTSEVPWFSLAVHGSKGSWTYPYNYKKETGSGINEDDVEAMIEKMYEKFGTRHYWGSGGTVVYESGGTLTDWVFEELGVKRSFIHEVLDTCDKLYHHGMTETEILEQGICLFQPDISDVEEKIAPQAWFGFKELLKLSFLTDCRDSGH